MEKECENCGRELYPIREMEVMEGMWLVVYRCPVCAEYATSDDFEQGVIP